MLETADEADAAVSEKKKKFQIQEKLMFPLEPESRK